MAVMFMKRFASVSYVRAIPGRVCCARSIVWMQVLALLLVASTVLAADWSMWGGTLRRNMVSEERDLPTRFGVSRDPTTGEVLTEGIRWFVRLGTQSFGNPVIADGRIFLGTNDAAAHNPWRGGDRGVLQCYREADGEFLWQLAVPKIPRTTLFNGDRRQVGICSSPCVDGKRLYVVTNRCEVLCLDTMGLSDGNDGPFQDESEFVTQPHRYEVHCGAHGPEILYDPSPPLPLSPGDADIMWRFDMISGVHSWPQDAANGSPLVYGDLLYVSTSNGICADRKKRHALYPDAPSVIALNKYTGRLVGIDRAGIGKRTWHGQWSSPALAIVHGAPLIVYGGGDGWCYAFGARPVGGKAGRPGVLPLVWRFDCNPRELRCPDGVPIRYKTRGKGPSEIIATPVVYRGKVYVAVGQDPEHGPGRGCLSCIDASQRGNISKTGKVWSYLGLGRSTSTVAIHDGRLYAVDLSGSLHCLDAETGRLLWRFNTKERTWGSPLVADGHVFLATTRGSVWIFADSPKRILVNHITGLGPIYSTPVAANKALYVMSARHLFVVARHSGKSARQEKPLASMVPVCPAANGEVASGTGTSE